MTDTHAAPSPRSLLADQIEFHLGPQQTYYNWKPSMADMELILVALRSEIAPTLTYEDGLEDAVKLVWDGTEKVCEAWTDAVTGAPTWTPLQLDRMWRANKILALKKAAPQDAKVSLTAEVNLPAESAPVAWIATYTDSAGQHHEPLHLSAHDANGGCWKVEVVLEQPAAAPVSTAQNRTAEAELEIAINAPRKP